MTPGAATMTSREPPLCFGPSPSTSLRFRFSSRSDDGLSIARVWRSAEFATEITYMRAAALRQLVEDVVRRQRAVLLAADRDRDDDGTRRLPLLLISRRLEDAFEQLAAVGRCPAGRTAGRWHRSSFWASVV